MTLEQEFPGFADGIAQLRRNGFTDDEITRAIYARTEFLKRTGASGEAIDALLKGKPSPLSVSFTSKQGKHENVDPLALPAAIEQIKQFQTSSQVPAGVEPTTGLQREPSQGIVKDILRGAARGIMKALEDTGQDIVHDVKSALSGSPTDILKEVAATGGTPAGLMNMIARRGAPLLDVPFSPVRNLVTSPIAELSTSFLPENVRTAQSPIIREIAGGEGTLKDLMSAGLLVSPIGGVVPKLFRRAVGRVGEGGMPNVPEEFNVPTTDVGMPDFLPENIKTGRLVDKAVTETPKATVLATEATKAADLAEQFVKTGQAPTVESVRKQMQTAESIVTRAEVSSTEALKATERITGKGGRPITRPVEIRTGTKGFSDEQARVVAAHRLARENNIPREQALQIVDTLSKDEIRKAAGEELHSFRTQEGELTGKRGRPAGKESLQLGQTRTVGGIDVTLEPTTTAESPIVSEMLEGVRPKTLQEQLRGGQVRLPSGATTDTGVALKQVRQVADSKGYEFQIISNPDVPVRFRLVGSGGTTQEFGSLGEANGFLLTQEAKPRSAVELKSPATGESAFEATLQDKPLTGEQKLNLQKQKMVMQTAAKKPLELHKEELPRTELTEPAAQKKYELKPNQSIGTVEDLATRADAIKAMAEAQRAGFNSKLIKTPDGYEVAFFEGTIDRDIIRALGLHRKTLNEGIGALSADEHAFMGRMFGISGEEVGTYLNDHGIIKGGAEGEPGRLKGLAQSLGGRFLARGVPPSGVPQRLRLTNPFAGGLSSGSPIVREATRDLRDATLAYDHELSGFQARLDAMGKIIGGGKGTPAAKRAMALKEGKIAPASEADRQFLQMAQSVTVDYANRLRAAGRLKEAQVLENYAPHVTDMDAVYEAFRSQFVRSEKLADLDPALRVKLHPQEYNEYKDVFLRHPNRNTVPAETLRRIQRRVFDFSDVVSSAENLPDFIKSRIPEEVSNRFLLPRNKGIQPIEDFFGAMEKYIGRTSFSLNFDPVLDKFKPVIESLPGSGIPFTERGFLERLFNNVVIKRPTWENRVVGTLIEGLNNTIGRELFRLDDINAASMLMKHAFLRGALGIDSAVLHSSHLINTWAETGRVVGPLFKFVQSRGRVGTPGVFSEFVKLYGEEPRVNRRFMQHALEMDRKFTGIVLSPMHLSDFMARGIGYFAGLEEGVARGLNGTEAMKVGFARSSGIIPDLRLTQAQLHALDVGAKTQGGIMPATRAPLMQGLGPLGRLSTTLITWPLNQIQFMQAGLRQGFAEAILAHEPARLMRFLALTGFWVTIPYAAAKMGADVSHWFGGHAMSLLTGVPFFRATINAVNAVTGHNPLDRERAKNDVVNMVKMMAVPQYRYATKVVDVAKNIERGYAVDRRGRLMYNTSTYGEIARLFNIGPEKAYDTRQMALTLHETALEYRMDKQKAVDALLDGSSSEAAGFARKWGRTINPQDLMRALQDRMTTPQQRAIRGLPREIGQRLLMQGQEE